VEPTVVIHKDTVVIEEDVKDYSTNLDITSRSVITLFRLGERCGMHIDEKSFPIANYQVENLPSGDVRIAVIMEFSRDSAYLTGELDESP